jgi:uncharacterized protein YegP (UPF0339 family)
MTGKDISHIEIRKAGDEEFYFVFRLPSDGMFVSVFFDSMSETMVAVESAKRNSTEEANYLCNTESADEAYFVFRDKNSKPIGLSTIFEQESTMTVGLKYMKKYLHRAEVTDLTT